MSERWEERLAQTAAGFAYPPTPNIAAQLRAERIAALMQMRERKRRVVVVRRIAIAVIVVIALGIGLWSVPPVRAAIVSILRIGAVTIVLEPTPTTLPTVTPRSTLTPQPTITPTVTPQPLGSVLDLGGETTLAAARRQVRFTIRLPTYPSNLGQPDVTFVQDLGDQAVMLVWLDHAQLNRVRLALNIVGPNSFMMKMQPRVISETTVNGQHALWTSGDYLLRTRNDDVQEKRLITGNVLIWTEGGLTYRLETDLSMAEVVKVAESLR